MAFTFKGHGWGAERAPLRLRPDGRAVSASCRGSRSWGYPASPAAARLAAEQGG